jgi:hypothetical protein
MFIVNDYHTPDKRRGEVGVGLKEKVHHEHGGCC